MIGAPFLLLVGLTGPFEADGDMVSQMAPPARPTPAASGVPSIIQKGEKRRAVRRAKRNDITETLRAMNLMRIGMEPPADQRTGANQ